MVSEKRSGLPPTGDKIGAAADRNQKWALLPKAAAAAYEGAQAVPAAAEISPAAAYLPPIRTYTAVIRETVGISVTPPCLESKSKGTLHTLE